MHKRVEILGVRVSAVNLHSAAEEIAGWVKTGQKAYVCVAPVSTLVDCQRDAEYRGIVNQADLVTPDGMPVVWLARAQGQSQVGRAYGPDLMTELCGRLGLRHYFFGGTDATLQRLKARLEEKFPGIAIAGVASPPFRPQATIEEAQYVEAINAAQADIVWVGLGSPKQDFWMKLNRPAIEAPVLVGVGAAFDFLAGVKPQAPRWMQRSGLEWAFRLACEPGRLWKRYLIGNSLFIFYLIRSAFSRRAALS